MTASTAGAKPNLRAVPVIHGALFLLAVAASVLDLREQFFGAAFAQGLVVPIAALVIGASREVRDAAGWRPILLAADLSIAVRVALELFLPTIRSQGSGPSLLTAALLVLALLALVTVVAGRDGARVPIVRTLRHRVLLVVLILFAIASVVEPILAFGGSAQLSSLVAFVLSRLAVELVVLVAWWWGSPWLLGLVAAADLVTIVEASAVVHQPVEITGRLGLAIVSLVALVVRPGEAATQRSAATDRTPYRSRAAAVWLVLGAVLFVPLVFFGLYPPIITDCFDQCPRPIPGADVFLAVDPILLFVVPLTAIAIAVAPGSGILVGRFGRPIIVLVGASFVLVQVALGAANAAPFEFLPAAAPAPVLLIVGAAAAIVRPRWLDGTRGLAAAAAGVATTVWIWAGIAVGPLDLPFVKIAAIGGGAVLLLALGRESRPVDR